MKKLLQLKTMILLCALVAGGSAWADNTVTWTVSGVTTSASGGKDVNTALTATISPNGATGTWTAVASSSYAGTSKGAQFGSGSYTFAGTITLSGTSIPSTATIKSIGITLSSSGTAYKISASVGGEAFGSQVSVNQKDSKEYTFSGEKIGNNIVLTFSNGGKKNVIITAISVTYANLTASDFAISTSSPLAIEMPTNTTGTIEYSTSSTGTITWESSDETVATVVDNNDGTATVTAHTTGSATISATQAADATYASSTTKEITVNVTDARTETTTAISTSGITNTDLKNGTTAGLFVATVTADSSPVEGASVSWTSSNPTIATIDASGNVTLVKAGTTTITASYAGNATYAASLAQYELTVVDTRQELEITAAFNYTFFGLTPSGSAVYAQPDVASTSVTYKGVNFNAISNDGTKVRYDADHMRLYNKNTLTITAPSGYAITNITLVSTGGDWSNGMSSNVGTYNDTRDANNKTYWTGLSNSVSFTPAGTHRIASTIVTLAETATITLASACTDGSKYYGTYSNSSAFVVPTDLTVSEINVEKGELVVFDYSTGDIVPANTGVMISSTTSGDHTVALTTEAGSSVLDEDNMLKASSVAMTQSDTKFYRLTMHNGTDIGFWWGAADGAAFDIAANKAYLAVPTSALAAARQGFSLFGEDEVNGIDNPQLSTLNSQPIYSLSGQRVEKAKKGLYIVNGKKCVIR